MACLLWGLNDWALNQRPPSPPPPPPQSQLLSHPFDPSIKAVNTGRVSVDIGSGFLVFGERLSSECCFSLSLVRVWEGVVHVCVYTHTSMTCCQSGKGIGWFEWLLLCLLLQLLMAGVAGLLVRPTRQACVVSWCDGIVRLNLWTFTRGNSYFCTLNASPLLKYSHTDRCRRLAFRLCAGTCHTMWIPARIDEKLGLIAWMDRVAAAH